MSEIAQVIEVTEERFTSIAPQGMLYDAEKGFAIQRLKASDFLMKVAEEQPHSLQSAICNVAAIGLSLSPAENLAYLVPRSGKVCLDISYIGFCRMATNSGSIDWVQAELFYADDTFIDHGLGEKPEHIYDGFADDRGEFKGVYCVAKTSTGDYLTTKMPAADVYGIRDRSESWKRSKSGPWKSDFGEMAKKSVIRRAFKLWPRTDKHAMERMSLAVQLSNEAEGFAPLLSSPDIRDYTKDQKEYFDQLLTEGDATGLYAFRQSIDPAVFTNLYHSFEKGTKGKYQRIIDDLMVKGESTLRDYLSLFADGDLTAVSELSSDEIDVVLGWANVEVEQVVRAELAKEI